MVVRVPPTSHLPPAQPRGRRAVPSHSARSAAKVTARSCCDRRWSSVHSSGDRRGGTVHSCCDRRGAQLTAAVTGGGAQFTAAVTGGGAQLAAAVTGGGAQLAAAVTGGGAQLAAAVTGGGAQLTAAVTGGGAQLAAAVTGGGAQLTAAVTGGEAQLTAAVTGSGSQLTAAVTGDRAQIAAAVTGGGAHLAESGVFLGRTVTVSSVCVFQAARTAERPAGRVAMDGLPLSPAPDDNGTLNVSCGRPAAPFDWADHRLISLLVLAFLNLMVVAGNLLVVMAVFVHSKLRTVTNLLAAMSRGDGMSFRAELWLQDKAKERRGTREITLS